MSSGFLLPCTCGKKIAVSKSQAGEEIRCECGEKLQVPTLRGFSNLEKAIPVLPQEKGPRKSAGWNPMLGVPTAIFFAAFLVASGLCANSCYWRWQVDTSYQVKDEIAKGEELLDKLRPAELLSLYRSFRSYPLTERNVPPFYEELLFAREREKEIRFYGAIAGGLLVASAIGVALSALVKPKSAS